MLKMLILLGSVFLLLVWALIPGFLGPDDLAGCDLPTTTGRCQSADAIVAISGGDTAARTQEAIKLYKSGWAPTLIFSGAAQDNSGPSNAVAMERQALAAGVPDGAVTADGTSQNTEQNAINTAALIKASDIRRIILVTSPYHQRRASMEFKARLGIGTQLINHPAQSDSGWSRWWWVTPTGWWLAAGELGRIFYLITQGIMP